MPATKPSRKLTLHDRLSRLTEVQAVKLLGPEGKRLLVAGGRYDIDINEHVKLTKTRLRVIFPAYEKGPRPPTVTVSLADDKRNRLRVQTTPPNAPEELKGAVLSFLLEEKLALGLSVPPSEQKPLELLNEEELTAFALSLREQRAAEERMSFKSLDPDTPWADYTVHSAVSGRTYRAALRGFGPGESYCSCRDFKTNRLGTCKHLIKLAAHVKRRFSAARLARPHAQSEFAVALAYGGAPRPRLLVPQGETLPAAVRAAAGDLEGWTGSDGEAARKVVGIIRRLESDGHDVRVYPDAEEWIEAALIRAHLAEKTAEIRRNPAAHPLRKELLKSELLPYQLDGVAFAAGACRAIIADEMGLGKTIQGIGLAAYLRREANISRVLVICPASLKSQWLAEIRRFCGLSARLVLGGARERAEQYSEDVFFTICNYEQVLRDILSIEKCSWDLIILDEGQRIKNWQAKTSRVVKGLRSPFAVVLSGTPMENRLDELFSVVEFIDDQRLGPAYRFFNKHRVVDESGKVVGFRRLDKLREQLAPLLLRRTRAAVLEELPPRSTQIIRIPPTSQQLDLHRAQMQVVSSITRKSHLTEMDIIRLQKALLMCRLSANGTYLVDKQLPNHSTKLEKLGELLQQLGDEPERKVVLFSEWTRMLDLVEEILRSCKLGYVRLDGSVPQKKRQQIVREFQSDPACRFIIMTNAGSTGLNLQAADTVVNVDLPWNPAVLEQRIGRAHRMGQKRPVQVHILVTEDTIEESLLGTLSAKKELALAALDIGSTQDDVALESGIEELKRRLEQLIGAKPDAAVDEVSRAEAERAALDRRRRLALSGGEMLTSVIGFLGNILPPPAAAADGAQAQAALEEQLAAGLNECVTRDADGRPTLQLTLPDDESLRALAAGFARFAALAAPKRD